MSFVAGIDAHTSYLIVAIVSKEGQLQERRRIAVGAPSALVELLEKYRPLEVVVETSSAWPWLRDLLEPRGIGFVLAHAKRLRAIAESTFKADEIDAELLARMRLVGLIPPVHAKPPEQREWGTLLRHRLGLVRKRTALINQVHGQLHQAGLRAKRSQLLTRKGVQWLLRDAWPHLGKEQRRLIRSHLKLVALLRPLIRRLDQRIAHVAAQIPQVRLLQTIPGIGPYRSLLIVAETQPIQRFRSPAKLVAYAGLAPVTRSSGGRTRHGSLPSGANRWLRGALIQAVVTHVNTTPESWLTAYYEEQKQRLGWQVARVAAARKLCRAVHCMLRTGETWRAELKNHDRGELLRPHAPVHAESL
jgi:transposase